MGHGRAGELASHGKQEALGSFVSGPRAEQEQRVAFVAQSAFTCQKSREKATALAADRLGQHLCPAPYEPHHVYDPVI